MQSFIRFVFAKLRKEKLAFFFLVSVLLITAFICFFRLGKAAFENWDEAWYADMTRNMLRTGNFIVPVWNGSILLDKPPLQLWFNTVFSLVFGLNETSVRLTSALAGFATILLAVYYAYRKWGLLPSILAFLTLVLNNIFIWRTRSGNLDALVTLLIFLTYLVIVSKHNYRPIFLGILFSLIYLAKVSLVVFPLSIFMAHEIIFRRKSIHKKLHNYAIMFGLMVMVCGVWLFLGYMQIGWEFPRYYLFSSDQGVVSKMSLANLKIDYVLYVYYALQRRFFYLLAIGVVFAGIRIKKHENFLLLAFSSLLLILLTFAPHKNNWYLMPSMPFWSLLIAYSIFRLLQIISKNKVLFVLFIFVSLSLSGYVSLKTYRENILPILNSSGPLSQAESGLFLKKMTKPLDTIVRTGGTYSTTVFYSDRKVRPFESESQAPRLFIGSKEVREKLKSGELTWLVGDEKSLTDFLAAYNTDIPGYTARYHFGDEMVVQIRQNSAR